MMSVEKAWGLFRLSLNGVFRPFSGHGQGVFIPEAKRDVELLVKKLLVDLDKDEKYVQGKLLDSSASEVRADAFGGGGKA